MNPCLADHERYLATHHDHPKVRKVNGSTLPFNRQVISAINSFHHTISRLVIEYEISANSIQNKSDSNPNIYNTCSKKSITQMCTSYGTIPTHSRLGQGLQSNDFLQVALRYTLLLLGVMNPLLMSQLLSNTLQSTQYLPILHILKRYHGIDSKYNT